MGCGEKLKQLKELALKVTGVACEGEDIDDVLCQFKNNYKDLSQTRTINVTEADQVINVELGTTKITLSIESGSFQLNTLGKHVIFGTSTAAYIGGGSILDGGVYFLNEEDFVLLNSGYNYYIFYDGNIVYISNSFEY